MAKTFADSAGSGMHLHVSLNDAKGHNQFASEEPAGNDLLRHAIGGMAATIDDAMALFAPNANSYRRFRRKTYAPVAPTCSPLTGTAVFTPTADAGLDRTHTWARTYWGGALYCLEADVRIHEQTGNHRGLQDALRAVEEAGAGMETEWPVARVFATGDAATGTTVMTNLYRAMKDSPRSPDLEAMWADLGVRRTEGGVAFDDDARLAAVRRAITRSPDRRIPVGAKERRTLQQPVE